MNSNSNMDITTQKDAEDAVRIVEFLTTYREKNKLPFEVDLHLSGLNWSLLKSIVQYHRVRQRLIDETRNTHK